MTEYIINKKIIILSNNNNNNIYNCFNILNEHININKYYDILNKLELYQINNLLNFIYIKWKKMLILINDNFKNNNYKNISIQKNIIKIYELNNVFNNFINNDKSLAIFIINCIHLFFN